MADLSVEICGLKFKNPIMPASGPTVRDGNALVKAAEGGAGGLVAKTVSVSPAHVPQPNMVKIKDSILNSELWSDLPLEQWLRFEYAKAKKTGLPLIASVGYKADEIRAVAPKVKAAGVDAIELATQHFKMEPELIIEATKAAKEAVNIPVFVKLGLDGFDLIKLAREVEGAGADGIVAINAVGPGLEIDIENTMPMLGSASGYGWLSGPAIKPLAIRCVADICRAVKIPVIGTGGINSGRDVVEFIMAGASAVQLSTAAIVRGHNIYGLLANEMAKFMHAKGYNSIADLKGIALRHLPENANTNAKPPEILSSKCTGCALCEKYCVYEAAKVWGKVARIDPVKCCVCGMCVSICPTRAIRY